MEQLQKLIISISRTEFEVFLVEMGKEPRVLDELASKWTTDDVTALVSQLAEQYKIRTVSILLKKDVAHELRLSANELTQDIPDERAMYDVLQKFVKESFTDEDWDYMEIDTEDNERLVFVPVMEYYSPLKNGLRATGFEIEFVESHTLAKMRHEDPVLGLALKGYEEPKGKSVWLTLVFVLLVLALGIGGFVWWQSGVGERGGQAEVEEVEPTAVPTPEPVVLNYADYTVEILNGSGIEGEAGRVQELLKGLGFEQLSAGNADSSDYSETVLSVKESSTSAQLLTDLSQILESDGLLVASQSGSLTDEDEMDVRIVLGAVNEE